MSFIKYIADENHYKEVLSLVGKAKQTVWIGTADIKDLYVDDKLPLQNFYSAEEYHQDYLDKGGTCDVDNIVGGYHPTGYCHLPESLFEFARKSKEKR